MEHYYGKPRVDASQCVYGSGEDDDMHMRDYKCVCDGKRGSQTEASNITSAWQKNYHLAAGYNTSGGPCIPCPSDCHVVMCLDGEDCASTGHLLPDAGLRLPLLVITSLTILGVVSLLALTCKYKKHKVIRAASPGLLYVSLGGSILLYSEVLVAAFALTDVTCMVRPWLRHFGFTLVYGSILLKMWRISVIMRVFKARMFRTKDSHLYKKLLLLLFLWCVYLMIWSLADPMKSVWIGNPVVILCQIQAWEFLAILGECSMLAWGTYLCVESRKAPGLYNETVPISYALLCEGCWQIFIIISRLLLYRYPDPGILFIVQFLRTQLTTTPLLVLLYSPKLRVMFSKSREVQGTLTDVYGHTRVHRLSLIINKHGDIRTIYCVPCGPLVYAEQNEQHLSMTSQEARQHLKEDEYSKAEVDALIELVSKLKTEKELHRMQAKRLLQLLNSKKVSNGLSPSLVVEEPNFIDLESPCVESPGFGVVIEQRHEQPEYQPIETLEPRSTTPGSRSGRTSTCTTFVSSCDDVSLTEMIQNDETKETTFDVIPGPCQGCALAAAPCHTCATPRNGISQYALNVLRRQLARNHVLEREITLARDRDIFPEADDFPKLIQSHEARFNNNHHQLTLPLLPTVYGDVCDVHSKIPQISPCNTAPAEDSIPEANDDANMITGARPPSPDNAQSPMIPNTPSDKMNFIMYI